MKSKKGFSTNNYRYRTMRFLVSQFVSSRYTGFFLALCFVQIACHAPASGQQVLTLEACIAHALTHNLEVKAAEYAQKAEEINLSTARSAYLPDASLGFRSNSNTGLFIDPATNTLIRGYNLGNHLFANSDFVLYNGLQYRHQLGARRSTLNAALLEKQKIEVQITLEITQAYLNALLQKEQIKIHEQRKAYLEKELRFYEKMRATGAEHERAVLHTRSLIAAEEYAIAVVENALATAHLTLAQLMGIETYGTPLVLQEDTSATDSLLLPESSLPLGIVKDAQHTLPHLAAAAERVRAAEQQVLVSKALTKPLIALQAGVGTRTSNLQTETYSQQVYQNNYQFVALNMSIPIFGRYTLRNNIQLSELAVLQSRLEYDRVRFTLDREVMLALLARRDAAAQYTAKQKQFAAVEAEMRYAEKLFANGTINTAEYNEVRSRYANTQTELLRTKYNLIFRSKIVQFYAEGKF